MDTVPYKSAKSRTLGVSVVQVHDAHVSHRLLQHHEGQFRRRQRREDLLRGGV